jgi:hypothetical protein
MVQYQMKEVEEKSENAGNQSMRGGETTREERI